MPNGTYGGVRGGVKTPPTRLFVDSKYESAEHYKALFRANLIAVVSFARYILVSE